MWTRTHSKVIKSVNEEAIWDRWCDVNNWHEWVPNIEYCQLEKPFQTGSQFILKPKGASAVIVQLVDVIKDQKFTGCTRFFGATMYDTHEMHKDPQGIRLTVTLRVTGPLGFFWRMLVAEKIANNLPTLIKNLAGVVSTPVLKKAKLQIKSRTPVPKKPKLQLIASAPEKAKPKSSPSAVVKKPKVKISASALKKDKPKSKDLAAKKMKAKPKVSVPKKPKVQSKPGPSALKKLAPKVNTSDTKKPKLQPKPKSKPKSKY